MLVERQRRSPTRVDHCGARDGLSIVSAVGGKCLDDSGDRTVDGNKIQLWVCNQTGAQDWTYQNDNLVGPGGKCLDVKYDDQAEGTVAWLYACNGSSAQKWMVSGTEIKSSGGLCLDAKGAVDADGTQVQIWSCNGTASQVWKLGTSSAPADAGERSHRRSTRVRRRLRLPPTPGGATAGYPIFSSLFRGNTPFHHTVASLLATGATARPAEIAEHYWAEGLGTAQPFNPSSGLGPLYQVHEGDPGYVFSCPAYGTCSFQRARSCTSPRARSRRRARITTSSLWIRSTSTARSMGGAATVRPTNSAT